MTPILQHQENARYTITLNRVERKNALTQAMYMELLQALEHARVDNSIRVLVLQGHEHIFTAGNDIEDFLAHPPLEPQAPVFRFLQALSSFPKPRRWDWGESLASLRFGGGGGQRGVFFALCELGAHARGGQQFALAPTHGLPPRLRGLALGRALHGRGRTRSGLCQ